MNIEKQINARDPNVDRLEDELHRALRRIERETPPDRLRSLARQLLRLLREPPGENGPAAADR